jgi:hypothetical protein
MIGAMIILTKLMNPSPKGFRLLPRFGFAQPTTMPRKTAIRTWTYRMRYQGFLAVVFCMGEMPREFSAWFNRAR